MTTSRIQKLLLGIAGAAAAGVGAMILTAPYTFYANYGINLGTDPSLVNELRAPDASLVALGMIILAGIFRPRLAPLSAILAVTVFLAYAFGRVVSIVVDGMPAPGLVDAVFIELAIGGLCLAAFWRSLAVEPSGDRRPALPVEEG